MSFTSVVNIWDNVSGSTPHPPHKTYKCLRNFPAGLYTHARWHLFKKKTSAQNSHNFVEFDLLLFVNRSGKNIHFVRFLYSFLEELLSIPIKSQTDKYWLYCPN